MVTVLRPMPIHIHKLLCKQAQEQRSRTCCRDCPLPWPGPPAPHTHTHTRAAYLHARPALRGNNSHLH
eukprot:10796465-Lingulodinium_polyedra.AAC.1